MSNQAHHHHEHLRPHHPARPTAPDHAPGPEAAPDSDPATERIRRRAFEISQARRGGPGDALNDWLQAEQELKPGYGAKR